MRRFALFQQAVVAVLVVLVAVAGFVFLSGGTSDRPKPADTSGARGPGTVAESALPSQAKVTIARIKAGGPFPFSRDGIVFENREGLLPVQPVATTTSSPCRRPARRTVAPAGS